MESIPGLHERLKIWDLCAAEEEERQVADQFAACMARCVPQDAEPQVNACERRCGTGRNAGACMAGCVPKNVTEKLAACDRQCEPPKSREEIEGEFLCRRCILVFEAILLNFCHYNLTLAAEGKLCYIRPFPSGIFVG